MKRLFSDVDFSSHTKGVKSYFQKIAPDVVLITGTTFSEILGRNNRRPNFRRAMMDVVDTCSDYDVVDRGYVIDKVIHAIPKIARDNTPSRSRRASESSSVPYHEYGILIAIDREALDIPASELQYKIDNHVHGFLIACGRHEDLNFLGCPPENQIVELSLVCSRSASSYTSSSSSPRKRGVGSLLMAAFLDWCICESIDYVILEVACDFNNIDDEYKIYGQCANRQAGVYQWYERLGFVERPELALSTDQDPLNPEINYCFNDELFLPTMIMSTGIIPRRVMHKVVTDRSAHLDLEKYHNVPFLPDEVLRWPSEEEIENEIKRRLTECGGDSNSYSSEEMGDHDSSSSEEGGVCETPPCDDTGESQCNIA